MKKKKFIFWFIIVFFFGVFFLREQYLLYKLSRVQTTCENQLEKIKMQNTQLVNQMKLTKRSDYIENLAREKLGLVKPDEILFVDKDKKR